MISVPDGTNDMHSVHNWNGYNIFVEQIYYAALAVYHIVRGDASILRKAFILDIIFFSVNILLDAPVSWPHIADALFE